MRFLQDLIDDELFKSEVKFELIKFNKNDKILEQGVSHKAIYLISTGLVRVIVHSNEAIEQNVQPGITDLTENDVFGEFGLIDDLPASADVVAVTETEVYEIDIAEFRQFLQNNPSIGYNILLWMLQSLVKRLRHADNAIFNLYVWGLKAHQLDKYL